MWQSTCMFYKIRTVIEHINVWGIKSLRFVCNEKILIVSLRSSRSQSMALRQFLSSLVLQSSSSRLTWERNHDTHACSFIMLFNLGFCYDIFYVVLVFCDLILLYTFHWLLICCITFNLKEAVRKWRKVDLSLASINSVWYRSKQTCMARK